MIQSNPLLTLAARVEAEAPGRERSIPLDSDALEAAYAAAPAASRDRNMIGQVIRAYIDAAADISKIHKIISAVAETDNAQGMTVCGYCGTWRKSPCGEGCHWGTEVTPNGGFRSVLKP